MPDMLVRLYDLPSCDDDARQLEAEGVVCRRAESYERLAVLQFIRERWAAWLDEGAAAFSRVPPTMHIAVQDGKVVGFAAYNATRPDFFGPTGVDDSFAKKGVGRVLLVQCLAALAAEGYAYAIIGGVGPVEFYEKAVGAKLIKGSSTSVYRNRVDAPDD